MSSLNRVNKKQNTKHWEDEFRENGRIEDEGSLFSHIRTLDEVLNKEELSTLYTILAISRGTLNPEDKLSKTWIEKAIQLDPNNKTAKEFTQKRVWQNKKAILLPLSFPAIRETDNRTAKKKIAEQYINICRDFLNEADQHLEDLEASKSISKGDVSKTTLQIISMLKEVIEVTASLLTAAEEYEQSITGVFYTSVHYQDLKEHLEALEALKKQWEMLFEEDEAKEKPGVTALQQLSLMIGMDEVKTKINDFYHFLRYQQQRKQLGFQTKDEIPLHMVLTGNPGTGKTTLARLLAEIYYEIGALPSSRLVEADRSQIVGAFVGQTEENVRSLFEKAAGGVLFIDEAYSLRREGQNSGDYGQTAIDTIVSLMTSEEFEGKLAVILAGYTVEMRQFLQSNPGLRSRFPSSNYIHLDDYTNDELLLIADKMAGNNDYILTFEAKSALVDLIERERIDESFGNARTVRDLILNAIFKKGAGNPSALMDYTVLDQSDFEPLSKEKKNITTPSDSLASLIGLKSIKEEMASLVSFIKLQQLRKEQGLPVVPIQLHSVFSGNPGTGKTTVAKIYSEFLKECGVLKRGHLIVTSRADFVAGYVGQTAEKTRKKIREALGGVLFIDEAYSLLSDSKGDFGKEVIDTLVDEMTKHNENLVIVLAGYTNEMQKLLDSNPGLRSRFKKYYEFPDYHSDELIQILKGYLEKYQYHLTEEASNWLNEKLQHAKPRGNGRFAVNIADEMIQLQAMRLMNGREEDILSQSHIIQIQDTMNAWDRVERGEKHVSSNEGN